MLLSWDVLSAARGPLLGRGVSPPMEQMGVPFIPIGPELVLLGGPSLPPPQKDEDCFLPLAVTEGDSIYLSGQQCLNRVGPSTCKAVWCCLSVSQRSRAQWLMCQPVEESL